MVRFSKKADTSAHRAYQATAKLKIPKRMAATPYRFISIDVETTGFQVGIDRILSIALFEISNGQIDIARSRKWIVRQPITAPTAATEIHGILPSETHKGIPEIDVLNELIPLITGAIVIGHHVLFDAAMLNEALVRNLQIKFCNPVVDTALLAMYEMTPFHKSGYGRQRPPTLDEVCAQLDLPVMARHTAEGDAFITAEVFLILCGKLRRRLQNRRLHRRCVQLRDLQIKRLKK